MAGCSRAKVSSVSARVLGEERAIHLLWFFDGRSFLSSGLASGGFSMAGRFLGVQKLTPILAILVLTGISSQSPSDLCAQTSAPRQQFACNTGYTKQECQAATAVLKKALARYPVDALGEWTWVLVRTVDWKQVLDAKGMNVNDPAFSNLTRRKTFLDGSLVEGVSTRAIELRLVWHMRVEELLDFAIRHELAHALCNEPDEFKANRIAISLQNGTPPFCRATQVAKNGG